ncbi:MAG TPA: hypothetical protein VF945_17465, partial [Polyangia bacterium]
GAGCGRSGELVAGTSLAPEDLGGVVDLAPPRDGGRSRDMGRDMGRRDLGVPRDFGGPVDLGGAVDLAVPADLSSPVDGGSPTDLAGGCTRSDQCPGAVCDWLTGQCVPTLSCNRDRDCPRGDACIAHQCMPVQLCLPFPGGPPCPPGEVCGLPGVCVPAPNCGGNIVGCPAGELCVAGYCQPDACVVDGDCNQGYACVAGQCRPQLYCARFDPCPPRFRCDTHVCVPR